MNRINTVIKLILVCFSMISVCYAQVEENNAKKEMTKFDANMKTIAFDSVSNKFSLIPNESIFDTIYVMVIDEITPFEANQLIRASKDEDEKEVRDKIEFYNLILYRKLNILIEQLVKENSDTYFVLMRERDISESAVNSVRFVIKPDFSSENIVSNNFRFSFYVYDRAKDLSYQSTSDLVELFDKYKLCRNVFKAKTEEPPTQSRVNSFAYLKKQKGGKEAREMSTASQWVIGGVIYAVVLLGINYLANL